MKRFLAVLVIIGSLCACRVGAQTPTDVPRDHWAYEAVRTLVEEGYLEGYPDGSFLGNRTLTRYEFAVVVKRMMDTISARLAEQQAPAAPVSTTTPKDTQAVKPEALEAVKKLVEEFKPELVVIGARIDKLEASVGEMKTEIEDVRTILTDEEGPLQSTRADVSKLKKISVSGYVQTRYNAFRSNPDKAEALTDTFSVRRARLKVVGKPTDKASVTVQFDGGQGSKGDSGPSVSTKDAFIEYYFAGDPATGVAASLSTQPILAIAMGQMKWPFGYEVVQSSSVRETPERSLIAQKLFPGERDRGFMVACPLGSTFLWRLGVLNGVETKYKDINNNKDLVSTLRADFGDLTLGISGYFGKGILGLDASKNPVPYKQNKNRKTRYGADLQYYMHNLSLKAEYFSGKGVDGLDDTKAVVPEALSGKISGGWAQLAYNITPANTMVVKWETISLDPAHTKYGRRSAWNLGLIRQLDDKTRLKAFYQINKEEKQEFDNNQFTFEWITTF